MQLELNKVDPGIYRHFKGCLYDVIDVAVDAETATEYVVYRSRSSGQLFIRAKSRFVEAVDCNGAPIPRFQQVRLEDAARCAADPSDERSVCCVTPSRLVSLAKALWSGTRQALHRGGASMP